jgi:hypothetical protein
VPSPGAHESKRDEVARDWPPENAIRRPPRAIQEDAATDRLHAPAYLGYQVAVGFHAPLCPVFLFLVGRPWVEHGTNRL